MAGLGAGNAIWVLGFSGLQIALQVRTLRLLAWTGWSDSISRSRSSSLISRPSNGVALSLAWRKSFRITSPANDLIGDCFVSTSTGGWYFINFYANGKISSLIVAGPGWRWGYGIYALCYLPALLPIVRHLSYLNQGLLAWHTRTFH